MIQYISLENGMFKKKQMSREKLKKTNFILLCFFFVISLSYSAFAQEKSGKIENDLIEIRDSIYHFKAYAPKGWILEKTNNKDSFCRLAAYSPTKKQSIYFYSLKVKAQEIVSVKKLSKNLVEFFPNLGELINEKVKRSFTYIDVKYYEKIFYNKETSLYSKARCFAYLETGYIIVATNDVNDFTYLDDCFNKTDWYSPLRDDSTKNIILSIVYCIIFMISIPAGTGYLAIKTRRNKWGLAITTLISTFVHCGLFAILFDVKKIWYLTILIFAMALVFGWQSRKKGKIWVITSFG